MSIHFKNKFLILLILIFTLFFPSCSKREKVLPIKLKKKDVKILFVSPKDSTEAEGEVKEIIVVFNQPMVPLEGLSEREVKGILKIEPKISGRLCWKGTSILSFIPDKPLPKASNFKVTVCKGIKSLTGSELLEDYVFSFETLRPDIIYSSPQHGDLWVELNIPILLEFNQPVSEKKAHNFIKLFANEKEIKFAIEKPDDKKKEEKENSLLLKPYKKFPQQAKITVKLLKGLPPKEGNLGLKKEKEIVFYTYNYFDFLSCDATFQHNPEEGLNLNFTNPVSYKELIKNISFQPEVNLPVPEYSEYDGYPLGYLYSYSYRTKRIYKTICIPVNLLPEKNYKVRISKNLKDVFGNKLGRDIDIEFRTTSYSPFLQMRRGIGTIENYGEIKYPIYVRNINRVRKRIAVISKEKVVQFLNQDLFYSQEPLKNILNFAVDEVWNFNLPRNKINVLSIDIKKVLSGKKSGFVLLEIENIEDLESQDISYDRFYRALLQVTNLGITGKFSPENNLIMVTNLKDAKPVSNAKVELRDDKNRVLWRGKTNEDGISETPGWAKLGLKPEKDLYYEQEQPRIWVFVSKGDDVSFINSSSDGGGIDLYNLDISYNWYPKAREYACHIFTEKGLYKPGENVYIKGILREKERGKWIISKINKLFLTVTDSHFEEILKNKVVNLSDFGSFTYNLKLGKNIPSGWYTIKITHPKIKEIEFVESFRVESYKPSQFEVKVQPFQEEYIFGDEFSGEITGRYLFGAPMSGDSVSYSLRMEPYYFSPPGHQGFSFGPSYLDEIKENIEEGKVISKGTGELDKNGRIKISEKLTSILCKGTMMGILEGTVTAKNQESISSRASFLIHRGEYYIGLRPSTTFAEKNKDLKIEIIITDSKGKLLRDKKINFKIIKREWHQVRKLGFSGVYEWVSEEKDKVVYQSEIEFKKEKEEIYFKPEKEGFYIIRCEGKDKRNNLIITDSYFYVTGESYVSWEREEGDVIKLVSDKNLYSPGETAKILIKSPYKNSLALITLEREYIISRFIKEVKGGADYFEFKITEEHLPNLFVSVILLKGRIADKKFDETGEDIGKPSIKIGYLNISVSKDTKKLKVEIETDKKEYRPKERVKVNISVKNAKGKGVESEIALAVVDLGVLNLIDYKTPDSFEYFYGERELSVRTADTRPNIISRIMYGEKGKNRSGDGDVEKEKKNFIYRTEFTPTAYYNPFVRTNREGKTTISFQLPDNLTTFKVMAIACTKDSSFGSSDLKFTVNKPLLLLPSLPRFVRLKDRFNAGVLVYNKTGKKGKILISAETEGIEIRGKREKIIKLNPNESEDVQFSYFANKKGTAVFRFRANMEKESDALEIRIPVKIPRLTETVGTYNQTTSEISEAIKVPLNIYPEVGNLEITTSSSSLSGLKDNLEYLENYPYECLEQKISRYLPFILAEDLINNFNLSELKGRKLRREIRNFLKEIKYYQNYDGGFVFWKENLNFSPSNPYLSCYVMYTLTMAEKNGYKIDEEMLKKGVEYLKSILEDKKEDKDNPLSYFLEDRDDPWSYPYNLNCKLTTYCFSLYVLSLLGEYLPEYGMKLYQNLDQIPIFGKCLLLKTFHQQKLLREEEKILRILLNKIKLSPKKAYFEEENEDGMEWIFSSNIRTTALVLQTILETKKEFPSAEKLVRYLIETKKENLSTQENLYVFSALATYYKIYEKEKPDFVAKVLLEGKEILRENFRGRELSIRSKKIPLTKIKRGVKLDLKVKKEGRGRLYYGLKMTYCPNNRKIGRDEGFAIFKTIEPFENKKIGKFFKRGEIYKIKLSIVSSSERNFVVVDDPLPAGFEIINTSFETESSELRKKLYEIRNKENNYWWGTFNYEEIYDDKLLLFADCLKPGEHTYTYLVKAKSSGIFSLPATKVEEMYNPEVFGYTKEENIEIRE